MKKISDKIFNTKMILYVLTMLICTAIFCGGTYAWFTAQQGNSIYPVKSATYSLSVEIDGQYVGTCNHQSTVTYFCPLTTNDEHTVTLSYGGTAENGYCVIGSENNTYNTVQIKKGESITLTIQAAQDEEITFSAYWGENSYNNSQKVYGNDDYIMISTTPYEIYLVCEDDTLESIAEKYGVDASDILLYNGISELTVSEEIKIPNPVVEEESVDEEENYVLYTVEEGVTIEMLSLYYGVSEEEILNFNGIVELTVGEEIKIPNTTVTEPFVLQEQLNDLDDSNL